MSGFWRAWCLTCGCGPRWCDPGAARQSGSCGPCPGRAACSQPCSHCVLRSRHQLKPGIITLAIWLGSKYNDGFHKAIDHQKVSKKINQNICLFRFEISPENLTRPHDVKSVKSPPRSLFLGVFTINISRHQYFLSSHHNIRGHNKYFSVEWWNYVMCGIFSSDTKCVHLSLITGALSAQPTPEICKLIRSSLLQKIENRQNRKWKITSSFPS